jgi:hypothetical protein
MMRRNWNHAVKVLACAALLAALGSGLIIAAAAEDDDRPPIIVHNGSLIFDGGQTGPTTGPEQGPVLTHSWSKDLFLDEWKPSQHAKGVRRLAVTFVPKTAPACAASAMTGEEVRIEYRVSPTGDPSAVMRVHLRRKHWFGKREPKIDPNGKELTLREHTSITPTPPMLVYDDRAPGWISKVTVDGTSCEFARPPDETARLAFRVRIQPKRN